MCPVEMTSDRGTVIVPTSDKFVQVDDGINYLRVRFNENQSYDVMVIGTTHSKQVDLTDASFDLMHINFGNRTLYMLGFDEGLILIRDEGEENGGVLLRMVDDNGNFIQRSPISVEINS